MLLKDKREVFCLVAAWILTVTFLLSFDFFRQSRHALRTIVLGTAAGLVIVIADNWGRWNGPTGTHSRSRNNGFLQRLGQ